MRARKGPASLCESVASYYLPTAWPGHSTPQGMKHRMSVIAPVLRPRNLGKTPSKAYHAALTMERLMPHRLAARAAWTREIRATLALSLPLVLTSLAQIAM